MIFAWVLGVVLALVIVALAGVIFYFHYSDKEIKGDIVFITNYMPQYAKGYSKGILVKEIKGSERSIIEFSPIDVDYTQSHKINTIKIVVENDKILSLPKTTLSSEKSELVLLPPRPEDFPEALKNLEFGKLLMASMENRNNIKEVVEILRNRINIQNKLLNSTEGHGLVEEYIDLDSRLNKDRANKLLGTIDRKKESTFSSPTSFNTGGS